MKKSEAIQLRDRLCVDLKEATAAADLEQSAIFNARLKLEVAASKRDSLRSMYNAACNFVDSLKDDETAQ